MARRYVFDKSLIMEETLDLTSLWQPASTIFSACTTNGTEVLLWLVPNVSAFESLLPSQPVHEVSFVTSHLTPQPIARPTFPTVDLVPTWWVFEGVCSPESCTCGARSLHEALSMLPRRLAGQALAAHLDLKEAVDAKLADLCGHHQTDPLLNQMRLAAAKLSSDLRPSSVSIKDLLLQSA